MRHKSILRQVVAFFAIICMTSFVAVAQQRGPVKGVVVDANGEAVIGAGVLIKGTPTGAVTDLDGHFELLATKGDVLVITCIGYRSIEQAAAPLMKIVLEEDVNKLEEVVVVGYGTMKKKDLTGSIASVRAKNVEKDAPRSVQDILRGGVAGVTMAMATTVAGSADIQIRGDNTLTAGSSPLIVLDGVIFNGSMTDINPADIETIDVLKDASSVAIYGAKAASGVIAITTKRGADGKPKVNFSANVGIAQAANTTPIVDGAGFIKFRQDYHYSLLNANELAASPQIFDDPRSLSGVDQLTWANYGSSSPFSAVPSENELVSIWLSRLGLSEIETSNYINGIETNWDDYYFPKALQQDYTVSVSNKSKAGSYYASVGYTDREGTIAGSGYKNIRGRINLDSNINNWLTIGANTQFAVRDGSFLQADTDQRERLSPYTTNEIDNLDSPYRRWPNGDSLVSNPFFNNTYRDRSQMDYDLNLNLYAIIKLPFGFEFQSNYSPRFHWKDYFDHQQDANPEWAGLGGKTERTHEKTFNWQIDNVLRWRKEFGDHRFEATFLQNAEMNQYWKTLATGQNYSPSDVLSFHYLNAATEFKNESNDTYATGDALMARLFYQFRNRYMITASVRRDGYSAFGVENPRGTFPSVALGWVFSEESFMRGANEWLNYGKLRVSYGINGNRDIGQYAALAQLTSGRYTYLATNGTPYLTSQIYISKLGNSHLKWEKTAAANIGLDYTLFNNFVDGSIDYYHSVTTDLLVSRSLPPITGYSSIYTNLGELQNNGFEFLANFHPVNNTNFKWDSTVTFYFNRRKINHLYGDMEDVLDSDGNVIGTKESDDYTNGWFIGHDPDEIYDYEMAGVWQLGEEEEAAKFGNKPGDFRYVDQTGEGKLTKDDKVFTGHYTTPRFQTSWRNDFNICKNWNIGFMMYAKIGQWGTYNRAANANGNYDRYTAYDIDRWSASNPTNKYARIGSTNFGNHYVSKSFLRMESFNISYSVPKNIVRKINAEAARLTLSVRNPFVLTGWEFGDVEGGDYTVQSVNFGINVTL